VVDRNSQRVALMASSEGGTDIEEVAARTPEKIHKLFIDPDTGLRIADADGIARRIGIAERSVVQARVFMQNLYQAFDGSDASLAEMVQALKNQGLWESTIVIVTAKHGQSPIDPNRFFPIPGHSGTNGQSPATLIANLLPMSESPANPNGIGPTEDDISLLWLADSSNTLSAVATLEANAAQAGIGQIYYGQSVALNYNRPGLGDGRDPRTPDIIVTPNVGVIYTGSSKKQEEHGGFAHDDVNVVLVVSGAGMKPGTVYSEVGTNQIAPTILRALGLDPNQLDGVRLEGTQELPALPF